MTPPLMIDGNSLTLQDVIDVARHASRRSVVLSDEAREQMAASRAWVDRVVATGQPTVYGINTGFGIFAARHIPIDQADRLSRNLIISHAIGIGEPFPEEVVRAAMLIRANTLAIGHSGIRPETVQTLIDMLNAGVHPIIPSQGSLGASGDLAPLSHLALVLSRDAERRCAVQRRSDLSRRTPARPCGDAARGNSSGACWARRKRWR